jgi:hypothetical protein
MNTLTKSAPLGTLGLPAGDHWVKFHVEGDSISFELATALPRQVAVALSQSPQAKAAQSFVEKWSGKGRLLSESEMGEDTRLAALTAKHVL